MLLQDSEEEEQLWEIRSVNWTECVVCPRDTELKVPVRLILDSELDVLSKVALSGRQGRVEEIGQQTTTATSVRFGCDAFCQEVKMSEEQPVNCWCQHANAVAMAP